MARFLRETIDSVLAQTYPAIEYVVRDGGSTDGTLELLAGYGERIQWRSAPDGGAAAALRSAFCEAKGEIFGWLNADDILLPEAVAGAVAVLAEHPRAAAVFGGASWISEDGAHIADYPVSPDSIKRLDRECGICQPACFFRAEAYRAAGGIEPAWNSAFDYDLWIRLARRGDFVYAARDWARSRMHVRNKTLGSRGQAFDEGMAVLERHYGYVPPNWVHSQWLWRRDGRDQFFEQSRGSALTWLASLPAGLLRNRGRRGRYLWDWLTMPDWRARLRRWSPRSPAT